MAVDVRAGLRRSRRRAVFDAVIRRGAGAELDRGRAVEVDNPVSSRTASDFMGRGVHVMADSTNNRHVAITVAVVVRVERDPGQRCQMIDMLDMSPLAFHGLVAVTVGRIGWIAMTGIASP